jgi:hypothetical protein
MQTMPGLSTRPGFVRFAASLPLPLSLILLALVQFDHQLLDDGEIIGLS